MNNSVNTAMSFSSTASIRKNSGTLVKKKYFAPYTIQGQIPQYGISPTTLGFSPFIAHWEKLKNSRKMLLNLDEIIGLSKLEIKHLNNDEKKSLKFFTSDNYDWVNKAIYQGGFENKAGFMKLINSLDSALNASQTVQKIVYRGISTSQGVLNNKNFNNLHVGNVLHFKGYQSATYDFNIANGYISQNFKNDGVIFEILTSRGINVSSVSEYDIEAEVILPRLMSFLIVGSYITTHYNNDKKRIVQVVSIDKNFNIF